MIGQSISHYKILEKLGVGGMGVVYKAQDIQLKRTVALKFLPDRVNKDTTAKERFLQEAQAAAALNHPNICTIHGVEDVDGSLFIVMEYIEGGTLREKIPFAKIDDAVTIAAQIGEALQEAHSKGIVHRDIKADNIMLTSKGQAKVMDFGLAKLKGALKLTKTSSTVGTLGYMAPEQIQGGEVDHRSDIFSFGVLLFEMLTGKLPFRGEHEAAMMYSIVNEEPQPILSFRKDVPQSLTSVIAKALEKDRTRRYQTDQELLSDLKQQQTKMSSPRQEKSIVVLPFENMSPDKENEYFSDGLTEEITADLSKISSLRVISRTSAMVFKGTKKDLKTIGRELHVGYVLEGSVRKAGNRIRITAQFIDASSDAHLWAEKFDGILDDVFGIQESVSRAAVDALRITLTSDEQKHIGERPIENPLAYDYYLKAKAEMLGWSQEALDRAKQHLQSALDIAGENALLYGLMAYLHWSYANLGFQRDENIAATERYVDKALKLDPELPEGHLALGLLYGDMRGNNREAIRCLKKVLTLNPNDSHALLWLSLRYMLAGKVSAAKLLVDQFLARDPLNAYSHVMVGALALYSGDFEAAIGPTERGYEMEPHSSIYVLFSLLVRLYAGRAPEAAVLAERRISDGSKDLVLHLAGMLKQALGNERSKVHDLLTPDVKAIASEDPQFSHMMASIMAHAGLFEEAMDWVENAIRRGFINYPFFARYDPTLEPLRGTERFQKLMEDLKQKWEAFEV